MNVMMLSAGQGTRLRPFTNQVPKPVIPFMTVPLACYGVELLESITVDKMVVNLHHLPDQVQGFFSSLTFPPWKRLVFSDERKELLGSGGGIHKAIDDLVGGENFLVMNADEVILPNAPGVIDEIVKFHRFHGGIATLMCMPHPEVGTKFGGAWSPKGSSVVSCFSKTAVRDMAGWHYTGVACFSDHIEGYFKNKVNGRVVEENILYDTLTSAMGAGEKVYHFDISAQWFETGNPTDFLEATRKCLAVLQGAEMAGSPLAVGEPGWANHLRQVIGRHSQSKTLIEDSEPGLAENLKKLVQG